MSYCGEKRNMEKFVFSMNNTSLHFWVQRQHRVLYIQNIVKLYPGLKRTRNITRGEKLYRSVFLVLSWTIDLSLRKCHKYSVNSFSSNCLLLLVAVETFQSLKIKDSQNATWLILFTSFSANLSKSEITTLSQSSCRSLCSFKESRE